MTSGVIQDKIAISNLSCHSSPKAPQNLSLQHFTFSQSSVSKNSHKHVSNIHTFEQQRWGWSRGEQAHNITKKTPYILKILVDLCDSRTCSDEHYNSPLLRNAEIRAYPFRLRYVSPLFKLRNFLCTKFYLSIFLLVANQDSIPIHTTWNRFRWNTAYSPANHNESDELWTLLCPRMVSLP